MTVFPPTATLMLNNTSLLNDPNVCFQAARLAANEVTQLAVPLFVTIRYFGHWIDPDPYRGFVRMAKLVASAQPIDFTQRMKELVPYLRVRDRVEIAKVAALYSRVHLAENLHHLRLKNEYYRAAIAKVSFYRDPVRAWPTLSRYHIHSEAPFLEIALAALRGSQWNLKMVKTIGDCWGRKNRVFMDEKGRANFAKKLLIVASQEVLENLPSFGVQDVDLLFGIIRETQVVIPYYYSEIFSKVKNSENREVAQWFDEHCRLEKVVSSMTKSSFEPFLPLVMEIANLHDSKMSRKFSLYLTDVLLKYQKETLVSFLSLEKTKSRSAAKLLLV